MWKHIYYIMLHNKLNLYYDYISAKLLNKTWVNESSLGIREMWQYFFCYIYYNII